MILNAINVYPNVILAVMQQINALLAQPTVSEILIVLTKHALARTDILTTGKLLAKNALSLVKNVKMAILQNVNYVMVTEMKAKVVHAHVVLLKITPQETVQFVVINALLVQERLTLVVHVMKNPIELENLLVIVKMALLSQVLVQAFANYVILPAKHAKMLLIVHHAKELLKLEVINQNVIV
jgi:hypothetical protein